METAHLSVALYVVYAIVIWIQVEYCVAWWKTARRRSHEHLAASGTTLTTDAADGPITKSTKSKSSAA